MWRQTLILGELRWYWDEGDTPRHRRYFREKPFSSRVVIGDMGGDLPPRPAPTSARAPRAPAESIERASARAVLGLRPDFESRELARAFRSLAFTHHPDRGGNGEQMKAISWAYAVLRG